MEWIKKNKLISGLLVIVVLVAGFFLVKTSPIFNPEAQFANKTWYITDTKTNEKLSEQTEGVGIVLNFKNNNMGSMKMLSTYLPSTDKISYSIKNDKMIFKGADKDIKGKTLKLNLDKKVNNKHNYGYQVSLNGEKGYLLSNK